jgi:hypothetical protein
MFFPGRTLAATSVTTHGSALQCPMLDAPEPERFLDLRKISSLPILKLLPSTS